MGVTHWFRRMLSAVTLNAACLATVHAGPGETPIHLRIFNEVPKFVSFHREVTRSMSADQRWDLWQRDYGLAAVPPTAFGKTLAREKLDAAWDRYADLMPRLPQLTQRAEALARPSLNRVAKILRSGEQALAVDLTLFVGQFDNNAFAGAEHAGVPSVFLPVEMEAIDVALAHEYAHALHKQIGQLKNGYEAPLGETLLMEGIAMHVSALAAPGHDQAVYVPTVYGSDWLARCKQLSRPIMVGILPDLDAQDSGVTTRFTYGTGTTGLNDEVYCAGWVLIEDLVKRGYSLADLARIPESDIPAFVRKAASP